jgi:5-methylcytosine-specific restriction endonuclease McrA
MPYKEKQDRVARDAAYHVKHLEKRRGYAKDYRKMVRHAVLDRMGMVCVSCGNTDYRVLQIDHIHNDGYKEGRGSRMTMLMNIYFNRRTTEGLQVLCANCHSIKTWHHDSD